MKPSPVHLPVCICLSMALVACSTGGPKVDVAWIGESVSSPQNDTVINESGQNLPTMAVQQAAPTAPLATAAGQTSGWGSFVGQIQQQPVAQTPPPAQPVYTPPVQPVAAPQGTARTYTVKQGDTLSSIAARHGVSTSSLISLNGLAANPNALRIGQVLQVPGAASAAAMPAQGVTTAPAVASTASYRTYTVVAGDTLSGIAARNGTTVSAIMAINGFTPDHANRIRIGQTIKLPRN